MNEWTPRIYHYNMHPPALRWPDKSLVYQSRVCHMRPLCCCFDIRRMFAIACHTRYVTHLQSDHQFNREILLLLWVICITDTMSPWLIRLPTNPNNSNKKCNMTEVVLLAGRGGKGGYNKLYDDDSTMTTKWLPVYTYYKYRQIFPAYR